MKNEDLMDAQAYQIITWIIWVVTALLYVGSVFGFALFMAAPPISFEFIVGLAMWYGFFKIGFEWNCKKRSEALLARLEYLGKHGE